nr:hypothetical protein [Tanacetum cinerariifolium]
MKMLQMGFVFLLQIPRRGCLGCQSCLSYYMLVKLATSNKQATKFQNKPQKDGDVKSELPYFYTKSGSCLRYSRWLIEKIWTRIMLLVTFTKNTSDHLKILQLLYPTQQRQIKGVMPVQTNKRKLETRMLFLLISLLSKLRSRMRNQKLLKEFGRIIDK